MTDLFQEPEDATPLDPNLRKDLLQTWITNRSDLNEAEQENILKGSAWARRSRRRAPEAVDILRTILFGRFMSRCSARCGDGRDLIGKPSLISELIFI